MDYLIDCLKRFNELPDYIRMAIGSKNTVKFLDDLNKRYNIDLDQVFMLVSIGDLKINDIPEYLNKKYKLNIIEGEKIKNELYDKLFSTLEGVVFEDEDIDNKDQLIGENELVALFQNNLKQLFNEKDKGVLMKINRGIIVSLSTNDEIQNQMTKLLINNNERLTEKEFYLEGKYSQATISNWLKSFFKQNGENIDGITISQFLINDPNAKKLDVNEKQKVKKLLDFYRNIKFFPDSLDDQSIENSEIFPVEDEDKEIHSQHAKNSNKLVINLKPGGINTEAATPKIEPIEIPDKPAPTIQSAQSAPRNNRIEELKDMATRYPEGSLERKMIEQEIKKLNN